MKLYELPFAKIIILDKNTAEVMIDHGVEMDVEMDV